MPAGYCLLLILADWHGFLAYPAMKARVARKIAKRIIIVLVTLMTLFFAGIFLLTRFYVEPALRARLQTLIVQGSDSLYTYKLGNLSTNLFGGRLTVADFAMAVDSSRYALLKEKAALPPLVMRIAVKKAGINGIGILALLFSKKIIIDEISSDDADINVLRNFKKEDSSRSITKNKTPLWKLLQPKIKDIAVDKIALNGIKLLYQNTEDYDAAQLQFERCDAVFEKIRIDSISVADTARLGYVENFSLRFKGLSFRSADSLYQMKADAISYASADKYMDVEKFSLQPTLNKDQRIDSFRKSWYSLSFDKASLSGLRLDRYLRLNRAEADSLVVQTPKLSIYSDKLGLKSYASNIGKFPHQKLLGADAVVAIKKIAAHNMSTDFTQRDEETREEGNLPLNDLEVSVANIVNDTALIKQNPVATAKASGKIIGSPIDASFRFYLDSAEGKFDVAGRLQNVTAAQINPLSATLANVEVPSANIGYVSFFVRGEDYNAVADVQMQYSNLSVVFFKRDKKTGQNTTRGFLTNLLNKYAIYNSNPASGTERKAEGVKVARLTTQSFFGLIWQAVFAGIQAIILKQG